MNKTVLCLTANGIENSGVSVSSAAKTFISELIILTEHHIQGEEKCERSVILGEYIVSRGATVRAAAKKFGISKSTVHKDLTEKLPSDSPQLYKEVKKVLETNKRERHIRGGLATKQKYEEKRKNCKK